MGTPIDNFNILLGYYDNLLTAYEKSSEVEQRDNQNKMLVIDDLIDILKSIKNNYDNSSDNLKLYFSDIIDLLLSVVNTLLRQLTSGCTDNKYVLSIGGSRLDSIVYNPDKVSYPETVNCPVKDVLVPQLQDGSYKVVSAFDATNGVLNTTIDMELVNADIFNRELNRTDDKKPDIPSMISSIIQTIIGQTNITEFTVTGENSGELLRHSSSSSQPPSTYAYGVYKNLKTSITDRYLKLNLKIHNPTQGFKITHLINVPQTYTNCYAQKEPNYEKI